MPSNYTPMPDDFRLADCIVQPSLRSIVRDGESFHLHNKALEVLLVLYEHRPEVVTKKELLTAVWPDTFVNEDVLSTAVHEVRRALGESAKTASLLLTVHGSGYRLDAPTRAASWETATRASSPRRLIRRLLIPLLALAALYWAITSVLAVDEADQAARQRRDAADTLYSEARSLLDQRNYVAAARRLQQAINRSSGDARFYDALANARHILDDVEGASAAIEKAIELAPNDLDRIRYQRRRAQIEGDTERELLLLQRGYHTDPDDPFWSFKLGWFYQTHKRSCAKSITRYEESLAILREPNVLSYFSGALIDCGFFPRALEVLHEYSERTDENADSQDLLGHYFLLTGELEKARRYGERALEVEPGFSAAHLLLARVETRRGDRQAALDQVEMYRLRTESAEHHGRSLAASARIHLTFGEPALALNDARESLAADPTSLEGLWLATMAAVETQNLELAQSMVSRAETATGVRESSRFNWEYYLAARGHVALASGDSEGASEQFRLAVANRPSEPTIFYCEYARSLTLAGSVAEISLPLSGLLSIDATHEGGRELRRALDGQASTRLEDHTLCLD